LVSILAYECHNGRVIAELNGARRRILLVLGASVFFGAFGPSSSTASTGSTPSTRSTSSTSSTYSTSTTAAALAWAPCYDAKRYDCARLSVPLDRSRPSGPGVSLSVLRVRATKSSKRRGVLLVNPGGPGASGRTFAKQVAANPIFNKIRQSYDVIGWDPRGVGESAPIRCLDSAAYDRFFAADPNPDDAVERAQMVAVTKEFVAGCKKRNGEILSHVSTADTVDDMDAIRVALGESKISFAGFSYGTYLGARYADRYPTRVDRFVLDGALDPLATVEQRVELQAIGFERGLRNFLQSCTKRKCRFIRNNETALVAFDRLMAGFEAKPLPVKWRASKKTSTRFLGPGEAYTAVLAALYNVNLGWPRLKLALNEADRGDGRKLLTLFDLYADRGPDGDYRNTSDANAAVNCTDLPNSTNIEDYHALAKRLDRASPHFGAFAAYSTILCAYWPSTGPAPKPVRAAGSAPILVLGTTDDPATPFVWAESLNRQLVGSRLIKFVSNGHTAILSGNDCVRKKVEGYLLQGDLPPVGATCQR
jgi:pimeloyl-ACP methyl ester carboxylesterase